MKKLVALVLVLALSVSVLCLTACNKESGNNQSVGGNSLQIGQNSNTPSQSNGNNSNAPTSSLGEQTQSSQPQGPIIKPDGTRNFESAEDIGDIDASWVKFESSQTQAPVVSGNSVTFTSESKGVIDTLVGNSGGANQSLSLPFNEITSQVLSHEFVYDMKVKANDTFTLILFAGENTTSEYTDANIVNNVAQKMGVYITFTSTAIEVKAALGNGTDTKPAESVVCLRSLDGSLKLDGTTQNELKITLVRYAYDNIMIQIYVSDYLVSFQKLVPKLNEHVYGLSLRTGWDGVDDGLSIGVSDVDQPSPFIRVSRGLTETEGLGKGLAVIPSANASVTLTDFNVLRMS